MHAYILEKVVESMLFNKTNQNLRDILKMHLNS